MVKFVKYRYILAALIFLVSVYFIFFQKRAEAPVENNKVGVEEKEKTPIIEKEKVTEEKPALKTEVLPNKISISVPFTSQAPFAKWDAYHEEACEEASLVMLKYYLDKKPLTPQIAEEQIQKMIAFEIKKYGDYKDTTAAETVKLFNDFYPPRVDEQSSPRVEAGGIKKLKVIYDFKKDDLKKYLAKGQPVIVPAAGRMLGNPNFTAPGPLYHNLVLVGYDGNMVITNDPGTRKGAGYGYSIDVLYAAIHDFPGRPEDIAQGRKAMIVLE